MAFHVACPITSERVCFCKLGFPRSLQSDKGKRSFLDEVTQIEDFLSDLKSIRVNKDIVTVQVLVPRVVVAPLPPPPPPVPVQTQTTTAVVVDAVVGDVDAEELLSAQAKRAAMQKKALAASVAAEEYARKFEARTLVPQDILGETVHDIDGEDQGNSSGKVMCRMCFYGENEGSERANRMLSCRNCSKKYHKSCLKSWSQHRDLFDSTSWVCPSCRSCEICRRTGDPTKFLFCKRCDGAYHCYCQHPPHKNVSSGPYVCSKHTKCHSCDSTIPGNGLSTRWFLGYTFCDACGRLFVKGNYCPVCLKVYRDSESIPMVCCDVCERWVHCHCDGISEEKYQQFQADRNLYYKCAACRGECYQVKDPDDAAQELWRRRDKAEHAQISSMRIAAGLPAEQDGFSVSDDDYSPITIKHDSGRSVKFSLKGSVQKTPKTAKEYGKKSNKKYGKKKGYSSVGKGETHRSYELSLGEDKNDDFLSYRNDVQEVFLSPIQGEKCSINQAGIMKHNFVDEVVTNREIKSSRVQIKAGKSVGKSEVVKGTKLVITLGGKNRNLANLSKNETSGSHREQDFPASNGANEGTIQQKPNNKKYMVERQDGTTKDFDDEGEKHGNPNHPKGPKHRTHGGSLIKFAKVKSKVSDMKPQSEGENMSVVETAAKSPTLGQDEIFLKKHSKGKSSGLDSKDHKPLLKLKFKNPWASQSEEDKSSIKGQRSKRKRPSPSLEKSHVVEDEDDAEASQENPTKDVMEANWILKKLGKDAIGKIVEVHQSSDSSWHKGVVTDVIEGTSNLAVELDDGRARDVDLGKQGVRFVSQKQKRSKAVRMSP
ncbi:hypothetical protein GIB67_018201 [Kingdonia uniflora]|uniref:Uncharacterized protein n=1 Tax=Kingdonia uniflora TaxID=39325 RepID=A0A7J7NMA4_9MAGN|nr:hypothetical protein GIB67_018201 [Kingdonia uniflora]